MSGEKLLLFFKNIDDKCVLGKTYLPMFITRMAVKGMVTSQPTQQSKTPACWGSSGDFNKIMPHGADLTQAAGRKQASYSL